jgi:hypothetical protein
MTLTFVIKYEHTTYATEYARIGRRRGGGNDDGGKGGAVIGEIKLVLTLLYL